MSLLDNIEDTLNSTVIVDQLYKKYEEIYKYFLGVTLKREKSGYPYFEINNAKDGIFLFQQGKAMFEEFNPDYPYIFPDWIEFRVKKNSYRKKYGGKSYVKLYISQFISGYISFGEDNNFIFSDTKQFDNCYVSIKKDFNKNFINKFIDKYL